MKLGHFITLLFTVALTAGSVTAGLVTLNMYTDDFGVLSIDGTVVGSYDGVPAFNILATLDLDPGWHAISIDYKNRFGTNFLGLTQQYPGDIGYSIVPFTSFRSQDQDGNTVNGLRGDYYGLDGSFLFTVFGEGPIVHGALSFVDEIYEGNPGLWASVFGPSADFEERLNGEILIAGPEPSSFFLAATALSALMFYGLRSKISNA